MLYYSHGLIEETPVGATSPVLAGVGMVASAGSFAPQGLISLAGVGMTASAGVVGGGSNSSSSIQGVGAAISAGVFSAVFGSSGFRMISRSFGAFPQSPLQAAPGMIAVAASLGQLSGRALAGVSMTALASGAFGHSTSRGIPGVGMTASAGSINFGFNWSSIDGSPGAVAGTIQYPHLCDLSATTNTNGVAFAIRPPWKVAGVDYATGVPSGLSLTPISLASIPGVTLDTTNHQVLCGGTAITLDGYDFTATANSGNNWRILTNQGNQPVTVTRCKFQQRLSNTSGSNPIQVPSNVTGSGVFLTVEYCEFDGNGAANNAAGNFNGDLMMILVGQGSCLIQYNWFHNMMSDAINIVGRSGNIVSPTIQYNFCESMGMLSSSGGVDPAHANFLQSWTLTGGTGSNINNMVCQFNTLYQPSATVDVRGRNIPAAVDGLTRMQAGVSGTGGIGAINNFVCAYNTCVEIGNNHYYNNSGTAANTGTGFLEWMAIQGDETSPVNSPSTHDNYIYAPAPGFTNFVFYPSGGSNNIVGESYANNLNMLNGAAYTTTP